MEQARQHQMDLLSSKTFTTTIEVDTRREQAQLSRMRNAMLYLKKAKADNQPSFNVLNTFTTKVGGEIFSDG